MKRHDLSFYLAASLVLHSLFVFSMWGWMRSLAEARPQYDVLKVAIIAGQPVLHPAAIPMAAARPKPAKVIQPAPLNQIMNQPQPVPAPVQEETTAAPADAPAGPPQPVAPAGASGGAPAPGVASGPSEAELRAVADRALANARDAYAMQVHGIIKKHFVYPALARKRGQEGRVQVSFIVGDDGRAKDVIVTSSSGFNLLDRAAVETILRIPLPAPPRRAMQIPITIVYRLEEGV